MVPVTMEVETMISDETKRKLRELNLSELINGLELQQQDIQCVSLPFDERLQMLTDYLYQEKYNGRVQRLIKASKFRYPEADINSIAYEGRALERNQMIELSTCQFIHSNTDVIFQGYAGIGKTYLACAIGKQACKQQFSTQHIRLTDLLVLRDEMRLIHGNDMKLLKKFSRYKLLILDEWLADELTEKDLHFILELSERRHDCTSTIFCTQYKLEEWHGRLGGNIRADNIMDRIVHNAIWIYPGDKNMRKYYAKQTK